MNQTQIFDFKGNQLRTIDKDGVPWFVLNDVVKVLGLSNGRMVKERLSEDVSSTYSLQTAGGTQQTTIINEDGLYDVILESRKPEAKAFRKWITGDVLPTIRKHGAYMTPETIEKTLTDPDFIIGLATKLKQANEEKALLQTKIIEDRPKVIFAEALEVSKDSVLIGTLSKILKQNGVNIGQNRLFDWMRENGYLISREGADYNMPTQYSMVLKIMEIKTGQRGNSSEGIKITRTSVITGKGISYFINKFKEVALV